MRYLSHYRVQVDVFNLLSNQRHPVRNEVVHPVGGRPKRPLRSSHGHDLGVGEIHGKNSILPHTTMTKIRKLLVTRHRQRRPQHPNGGHLSSMIALHHASSVRFRQSLTKRVNREVPRKTGNQRPSQLSCHVELSFNKLSAPVGNGPGCPRVSARVAQW